MKMMQYKIGNVNFTITKLSAITGFSFTQYLLKNVFPSFLLSFNDIYKELSEKSPTKEVGTEQLIKAISQKSQNEILEKLIYVIQDISEDHLTHIKNVLLANVSATTTVDGSQALTNKVLGNEDAFFDNFLDIYEILGVALWYNFSFLRDGVPLMGARLKKLGTIEN